MSYEWPLLVTKKIILMYNGKGFVFIFFPLFFVFLLFILNKIWYEGKSEFFFFLDTIILLMFNLW